MSGCRREKAAGSIAMDHVRIGGRFIIGARDFDRIDGQVPAIMVSVSAPTEPAPSTQALTSINAATNRRADDQPGFICRHARDMSRDAGILDKSPATRLANSGIPAVSKKSIRVRATRQIEHAAAARVRRIGAGDTCQPHAQEILAGQRPAGAANDL